MHLVDPVAGDGGSFVKHDESVSSASPLATRLSIARMTLKAATHDIHERMHRHPALARLAAGTIKQDEYLRVLARSYGFYAVAEPALGLSGRLAACLRNDLADLGMTPVECAELPHCAPLVISKDQAELIGARYVLLGASLGGKVMARAIAGRTDSQLSASV